MTTLKPPSLTARLSLRRRTLPLILGSLLLACQGCDRSGIHPIGQIADSTVRCDEDTPTSTWLRSMVDTSGEVVGTEVLLLGWRPQDPADQGIDTELESTERCMARIKVWGSTTTEEHNGEVTLSGDGNGVMSEIQHCSFHIQPGLNVLKRRGARCADLAANDAVEEIPFSFQMSGSVLEMTFPEAESEVFDDDLDKSGDPLTEEIAYRIPAGTYRYMNANELAGDLQARREDPGIDLEIWRLFHLSLVTSQARLGGFGSGSMTQYVGSKTEFVGLVAAEFSVVVKNPLNPRTTITYTEMQDFAGFILGTLEGDEQITTVDLGGNGGMEDWVSFELQSTIGQSESAITGRVLYDMTIVNRGFGNEGNFELTVDGSSYSSAPRLIDVDGAMGFDETLPGNGHFRFNPAVLDPDL